MSHGPRRLPHLPIFHPAAPPVDADLLARWVLDRDEAAFELLLRRHAPLVLGVCRRVLLDPNDADDAFQATFFVLARKASSVTRGELLAAWLHRVACRAALRIRYDRQKRAAREEASALQLPERDSFDPGSHELQRVLDEEVSGLSERQRAAFVLCCLEGKTGEEVAQLLGCPPGTVSSRLTRARERLRDRLTRRGFAPAIVVAALAGLSSGEIAAAPASLIESSLVAALGFVSGRVPTGCTASRPAAIAQGVIRAMTTIKLTIYAVLVATALLAVGGVLVAARPGDDLPPPASDAKVGGDEKRPAPPVVRVVRPQAGGLDRTTMLSATAEPAQQAQLVPGVTGVLQSVEVDIGDRVRRGQVLAQIDAPTLAVDERQAAVGAEQAQAALEEAKAKTATARAEVAMAKAAVKQREAEAAAAQATLAYRKKQLERLKELFKTGAIDQRVLDEAEDHYLSAEAQTQAAAASIENAKAELEVKTGKLLQAEAGVATAKLNVDAAKLGLEKARLAVAQVKILAPFDGVVTRRNCSPGDSVRPADRGDSGGLFTVMRTDVVRMVVAIPEHDLPLVSPGIPAEVKFDALAGVRVSGKVARVGFAEDPATRTMRAEIDIPNAKGDVRPGMFGSVVLVLERGAADGVRIPVSAVVTHEPLKPDEKLNATVYVYRDGKARLTRVRIERKDGKEAEVLSGLTAADRVVVNPTKLSGDELPVEIEKTPPK